MLCKLYIIKKNDMWYGVFTSPEGSCRRIAKSKGALTMPFASLAREVYKCKLKIVMLEDKNVNGL